MQKPNHPPTSTRPDETNVLQEYILGLKLQALHAQSCRKGIEIEAEGLEDLRDGTGKVVQSEWARVKYLSVAVWGAIGKRSFELGWRVDGPLI
jgi:hypothetical protein